MDNNQKRNKNGKSILVIGDNKKNTFKEYIDNYKKGLDHSKKKYADQMKAGLLIVSNKNIIVNSNKLTSAKNKKNEDQKRDLKEREGIVATAQDAQDAQKAVDIFMNGLAVIDEANVRVFDYKIYKSDVKKIQTEYEKKLNRSIPNISPKKILEMKLQNAELAKIKAHTDAIAKQAQIYAPNEKTGAIYRGGGPNNIEVVGVKKVLKPISNTVGGAGLVLDSYEAVTYYAQGQPDKGTAKVAGIGGSIHGGATGVALAGKLCPKVAKGQPVRMVVAGGLCFATLWYAGDTIGSETAEKIIMNLNELDEEQKKKMIEKLNEEYGVGMYEEHVLGAD